MGLTTSRYPGQLPTKSQTLHEDSAGTELRIIVDKFMWTWSDEVLLVFILIIVEYHADGTIIKTKRRTQKSMAGDDLTG